MNDRLELMLADQAEASVQYRPTRFWQPCCEEIVEDLRSLGLETFRRHPSALRYYVPRYGRRKFVDRVTGRFDPRRHWATVRRDLPRFASFRESTFGDPETLHEYGEGRFSRSALNYLRLLAMVERHGGGLAGVSTILELGSGYGTLGELAAWGLGDDAFYLGVDLAPLAHVSTSYLEHVLGADAVAGYERTRDLEVLDPAQLRRSYRAVILCAWQLPRLVGPFDLFVNAFSFQEMEPDVVEMYAKEVTRLEVERLVLRNSATGKPVGGDLGVEAPVVREDYVRFFDRYERLATDSQIYGDARSKGLVSEASVWARSE